MSVDAAAAGGGSALDQLIAQYEAVERRPIDELEFKREELSSRNSTYDELKSKTKDLRNLAVKYKRTGALSEFGDKKTTSSDEKVLTATGNANALDGSHVVEVIRLAKSDTVISNQVTKSATEVATTEGAGTKAFDVTVDGETFNVSFDITGTETNEELLTLITNNINDTQDIKIGASVVNDSSTTQRLTLTSNETGLANAISISDTTGTLLASLGLSDSVASSGTSGGYLYDDSVLDAAIKVDSIDITSSSNQIKDVISGVTLNLHSAEVGKEVTIGVETDVDGLKSTVKDFLEKYNGVVDYINGASFVDKTTFLRGPLSGDTAYQNLRFKLRSFIVESVTGLNSDQPTSLAAIGVTIGREGKLTISDDDLFKEKAEEDPRFISDLFNSDNGLGKKIDDYLLDYTQTGGIIDQSKSTTDEKIQNVNDRIKRYEARLEVKLEAYRRQFAQLQQLLSNVQSQQSSLATVLGGSGGGGFY